jgi:hypothetical protein
MDNNLPHFMYVGLALMGYHPQAASRFLIAKAGEWPTISPENLII